MGGAAARAGGRVGDVYAMFNNNGRSTDVAGNPFAQAPANAAELLELLGEAGVPVAAAR